MKLLYYVGRFMQLAALIVRPFAIWVGQFGHNEPGSITIFAGSIVVFYLGWLLTKT